MEERKLEDWRLGEASKTPYLERIRLMDEWLKQNNIDILSRVEPITSFDDVVVGFPDE